MSLQQPPCLHLAPPPVIDASTPFSPQLLIMSIFPRLLPSHHPLTSLMPPFSLPSIYQPSLLPPPLTPSPALPLPQGLLQSPDSKFTLHDEPEAAMAAKFTCSERGNNFPASGKLLHTGEQPYVCSECGKRITQSSSLIQQRKIHLAEKPHLGVECGCGSSQRVHLISHPANALRGMAVCSTSVSSAGKLSGRGLTSPDEPMWCGPS